MAPNMQNAQLRQTAGLLTQFPLDPLPQIALSGRSNVGKSSLINTLLNRKSLARVSSTPGKTITVNFYEVDRTFFLVDLPGYGFAKRPLAEKQKWSELTEGYFTKNPAGDRLALVIQLIDLKVGPTRDDRMMLSYLRQTGTPYLVVATKADKLNATGRREALLALREDPDIGPDVPILPFSSQTGEGKAELTAQLFSCLPHA